MTATTIRALERADLATLARWARAVQLCGKRYASSIDDELIARLTRPQQRPTPCGAGVFETRKRA